MLTLPEIKDKLQDRVLPVLAKETGIHYNTIRKIRDDEKANPTWQVLKALSDYFESRQ